MKKILKFFKNIFFKNEKITCKHEDENLKCPEYDYDKWYELAGGGSFGNIKCGNCNSEFNNVGIFGLHKIK